MTHRSPRLVTTLKVTLCSSLSFRTTRKCFFFKRLQPVLDSGLSSRLHISYGLHQSPPCDALTGLLRTTPDFCHLLSFVLWLEAEMHHHPNNVPWGDTFLNSGCTSSEEAIGFTPISKVLGEWKLRHIYLGIASGWHSPGTESSRRAGFIR